MRARDHRGLLASLGPVRLVVSAAGRPHVTEEVAHLDEDRTWSPFRVPIPLGLPPATEAHAISWRYELTARRRDRGLWREHAALTPLLFEAA